MTGSPHPHVLEMRSEQEDVSGAIDCSPTSLTGTDAMLTEMPLEDEEYEEPREFLARREQRANAREKATAKAQVKSPLKRKSHVLLSPGGLANDPTSPMRGTAQGAIAAVELRNRRRQMAAAQKRGNEEAELSDALIGEWEIRATETDARGKRTSNVWGDAVITTLADAALVRHKGEKRIACTFEGSFETSVVVRWAKHYATLDMAESSWQKGRIKWRLQPLPNGKSGGYITWRRKQVYEESAPRTPKRQRSAQDHQYAVMEVTSDEQKEKVWQLHTQKAAFAHDHHHLRNRVFQTDDQKIHCRSWLLTITEDDQTSFLGAATVRINPYLRKDERAWAQIMNLSVSEERRGYGTRLMAGVEELLWRERVDVCALYPVPNNRADSFWTSLGYSLWPESLLPPEELDARSGALLVEGFMENGVKKFLPRWEKSLVRDYPLPALPETARERPHDEATWKALKRSDWPVWRKVEADECKLNGEDLGRRLAVVHEEKAQRRAQEKEREHKKYSQDAGG